MSQMTDPTERPPSKMIARGESGFHRVEELFLYRPTEESGNKPLVVFLHHYPGS